MKGWTLCVVGGLTVVIISGWGSLTAQVSPDALKNLQVRPQVTAVGIQHNRSISAALDIRVRVANLTDADISLEKVEVLLPAEFLAAREGTNPPSQAPDPSNKLLHKGSVQTFLFSIPPGRLRWWTQSSKPQLLAFVPGDYEAVVRTSFQVPPRGTESEDETAKVSFEPPLGVLIWGGIYGAVLLALFASTYRYLRQTSKITLRAAILQGLGVAIGGAVSATIALILLDRLKGVELPVNITVKDFYGGVVIGLFSFKIGDWLYTQLFGQATVPAFSPSPPASIPPSSASQPAPPGNK